MTGHSDWKDQKLPVACPLPMTRAALLSLRAAGALRTECPYTITDHVQNRLVAGTTITLRAVSANELSELVDVNTTYDNEAWEGRYNLDLGLVVELRDNNGNLAKGTTGNEVANFDWGNLSWINVEVIQSTLTVTYGATVQFTNVTVKDNSVLNIAGFTGALSHCVIDKQSTVNLSGANGTWVNWNVSQQSSVNGIGYTGGATRERIDVTKGAALNLSNSACPVSLARCTFSTAAVTLSGLSAATGAANISRITVDNANLIKDSGSGTTTINGGVIETGATVRHTGAASMNWDRNQAYGLSTVGIEAAATGAFVMTLSKIGGSSSVAHRGNGSVNVTRLYADQLTTISNTAGSLAPMTLTDVAAERQCAIQVLNTPVTGSLFAQYCNLSDGSFIYKRHDGNLSVTYSDLSGQAGVDGFSGNRNYNVNRAQMRGPARMNFTGTNNAATDTYNNFDMSENAALNISCSGPSISFTYFRMFGVFGNINVSGVSGGLNFQRVTTEEGQILIVDTTITGQCSNLDARHAGLIQFNAVQTAKTFTAIVADGGTCTFNNSTGGNTIGRVRVQLGGSYVVSGAAQGCTQVDVAQGPVSHNGGSLTRCFKRGGGTLTTGNFNHTDIVHMRNTSRTLTAANSNRAEYQGLAAGAYTGSGILI